MTMRYALFAVLLLADPRPVLAGSSCGGGSSSDSSSSSSSSSSSDSDSGSGSDDIVLADSSSSPPCIDDTDVLGFRHCTKFGAWAKNMRFPRLFIEGGTMVRSFGSGLGDQTGSISHGLESFSYRVVMTGAEVHRDVAVTTNLRIGFGIPHGFYGGIEGEIGGLVAPASATAEMTSTGVFGSPNVQQQNGLVLGLAAVGGFRVNGGRGSLAIEGAGGLRSVRYTFASSYHECETDTTIVDNRSVVEARARAELWLSPWLTAGVTVGSNVVDQHDWMAGIYLGAHSRAFAGGR